MFKIACLDSYNKIITHLTQWDKNITLYITGTDINFSIAPLCHFCNKESDDSYVVESVLIENGISVQVPNILLTESSTILLYVYALGDDGSRKTIYTIRIPVKERAQPQGYVYEDNVDYLDLYEINENMQMLNKELENVKDKLSEAMTKEKIDKILNS